MGHELLRRVVSTTASGLAEVAREVGRRDPGRGSDAIPLGGGWLVISGRGLYVNRLMAAGFDGPFDRTDLEVVEARSAEIGVAATVDVTEATAAPVVQLLRANGFEAPATATTIVRSVAVDDLPPVRPDVEVRVIGPDELALWQQLSADGWGHSDPAARRSSDVFTEAVAALEGDHLLIAMDRGDRRPLGCASLSVRDAMGTLGGMSTLPAERRRGVQSALITARVELALEHGCDLVVSSAVAGSASERNLLRHGFRPLSPLMTYQRPVR